MITYTICFKMYCLYFQDNAQQKKKFHRKKYTVFQA